MKDGPKNTHEQPAQPWPEDTPANGPSGRDANPSHDGSSNGGGSEPPEDQPLPSVWWLWLILAVFVVAFAGLAQLQQQALQEQQMPSLTQPLGNLSDDPQFRLTARYALGIVRLAKMSGQGQPSQPHPSQPHPSQPQPDQSQPDQPQPGQAEAGSDEESAEQADSNLDRSAASYEEMLGQFMDTVDESATTVVQQIRAVPVAAGLRGQQAALQRLEDLATSIPFAEEGSGLGDRQQPGEAAESGVQSAEDETRAVTAAELLEDVDALQLNYEQGADALSQEQRQGLLDRHGWYARLALQQGGDETVSVDAQIWRTTLVLLAAALGIIVAGLAGFVLLVAAILQLGRGQLRLHFRAQREAIRTLRRPLLEVMVLFLPLLLVLTLAAELLGYLAGTPPLMAFFLWGAILAALWPLVRGVSRSQLRQALGWHRGRGAGWEVLSGIAGYLAGLPIMAAGLVISLYISQILDVQPTHPAALEALSGSLWQVIQIFLLACVWAPVVEESIFRGALFSHLRLRYSALASALLSGVIFAAIHPQGLAALPILGAIGLVLALIREWRGSLIAPMTAHALNNLIALTLVLLLMR